MILTVHEGIQILVLITPVTELPRLLRKCPTIVNKLVEPTGFQELPWPISYLKQSHKSLKIKS